MALSQIGSSGLVVGSDISVAMLEAATGQLATIAGQAPSMRRAKKSIANFKVREGMPVGVSVTLLASVGPALKASRIKPIAALRDTAIEDTNASLKRTVFGLAIIHTAIQIPFSVYIMRNSFEAVPRELEEAAIIDGCSSWQVLNRICLPAIRPAIVTVSLFAFVTSWNEFLAALVIMNRGVTFTLPLVLAAVRQETSIGGTDWGLLQAGITISVIPCILFYVLLQKYYVSGFLSGAVK